MFITDSCYSDQVNITDSCYSDQLNITDSCYSDQVNMAKYSFVIVIIFHLIPIFLDAQNQCLFSAGKDSAGE